MHATARFGLAWHAFTFDPDSRLWRGVFGDCVFGCSDSVMQRLASEGRAVIDA